jgi:bifunctional DNA primase/polymerase-like protein
MKKAPAETGAKVMIKHGKADEALQTSAPEALKAPGVLMPNDTHTTTGAGKQGANTAKEAWNQAAPFPIAENIHKLKIAVTAARQCKTQGEAAEVYAKLGIPVFPCNSKPDKEGKLRKYPLLGEGGLYLATTDLEQVREWWNQWPEALIGVPMGRRVGMWAVDADSKEKKGDVDGLKAWFDLVAEHDPGSAVTRAHKTGTEGLHFLYLWHDNRFVGCPTMKGIGEIKGEGGYVIFPPSPYTLNEEYSVTVSRKISNPSQDQIGCMT